MQILENKILVKYIKIDSLFVNLPDSLELLRNSI